MHEATPHHTTARQSKGNAPQFKFQLTSQLQDFGGKTQGHKTGRGCRAGPRAARCCLLLFTNVSIQCAEVEINSAPRFDRDQAGREVSHACPRLFVSLRAERARRGRSDGLGRHDDIFPKVCGVNQEVKKSKPTAPGRTKSSRPDNRWDGGATIGIARVRGKWKRREKWRGA